MNRNSRIEICVVCGEFLAFEYVSIFFFGTNLMKVYNCISKTLKHDLKSGFSVHNYQLDLYGQVEILNGYCVVEKQVLNVGI